MSRQRAITLVQPIPVQDVVWVPVWEPESWRDDEQDRIQPEQTKEAS